MMSSEDKSKQILYVDGVGPYTYIAYIGSGSILLTQYFKYNFIPTEFLLRFSVLYLILLLVHFFDRTLITVTNESASYVIDKKEITIPFESVESGHMSFNAVVLNTNDGVKYLPLHGQKIAKRADPVLFVRRLQKLLGDRFSAESFVRRLAERSDPRVSIFQDDFKQKVGTVEHDLELRESTFERHMYAIRLLPTWLFLAGLCLFIQSLLIHKMQPLGFIAGASVLLLSVWLAVRNLKPLRLIVGNNGIGYTLNGEYFQAYSYSEISQIRYMRRMHVPNSAEYWVNVLPKSGAKKEIRILFKEPSDVSVLQAVTHRIALDAEGAVTPPRDDVAGGPV